MMIILGLTADIPKSVAHQTLMAKRCPEHMDGGVSKEAVLSALHFLVSPVSRVFVLPCGNPDWEMTHLKNEH